MRISRLELTGFKSFPDRTRFLFGSGVSCIVGPNGCGKSNIVDALKWCIGEMSPKSLRGSEMLDVIFAGSTDRKPVGFADVAITFEAAGEPFPGEYAHLSEVSIGRRLHRNGTSEYLINQVKVRRKDVVGFFLDTGISTDLYAFIEQGKVDKVVNASPADRRILIDEAAGISKYKVRRDEAQQRLEATAGQLDRAADVADEMGRRLKVLERQVVKAARFRRLRALIRLDELTLSLAKYAALSGDRRALRSQLREARGEEAAARRELTRRQTDLRSRREELDVVEKTASTWRDELAELDARQRELSSIVTLSETRARELAAERDGAAREEALAREEAEEVQSVRARHLDDQQNLQTTLDEARAGGGSARDAVALARKSVEEREASLAKARQAVELVDRDLARVDAELEALEQTGTQQTSAELEEEASALASEREQTRAEISRASKACQAMERALEGSAAEVEEAENALAAMDIGDAERDLREAENKVDRARAKAEARLAQVRDAGRAAVELAEEDVREADRSRRQVEQSQEQARRQFDAASREALSRVQAEARARSRQWRDAWTGQLKVAEQQARDELAARVQVRETARLSHDELEDALTRLRAERSALRQIVPVPAEGETVADRMDPEDTDWLHFAHLLDLSVLHELPSLDEAGEGVLDGPDLQDRVRSGIVVSTAQEAVRHFLDTGEGARSEESGVIIDATGWVRWEGGRAASRAAAARRIGEIDQELAELEASVEEVANQLSRADAEARAAHSQVDEVLAKAAAARQVDVDPWIEAVVEEEVARQDHRRQELETAHETEKESLEARWQDATSALEQARADASRAESEQRAASEARLEQVLQQLEAARHQIGQLRERRGDRVDQVRLARDNQAECRVAQSEARARLERSRERLQDLEARTENLERRRAAARGLEEKQAERAATLRTRREALGDQREVLESAQQEARDEAVRARTVLDDATTELTRLDVRLETLEQRLATLRRSLQDLDAREQRVNERIAASQERARTVAEGLDATHKQRREALADLEAMESTRAAAWDRLQRERERLKQLREGMEKAQDDLASLQQRERDASDSVQSIDHRVQELRLEVEVLKRRAQERYQLSLPGLLDRMDAQGRLVLDVDAQVASGLTIGNKVVEGVAPRSIRPGVLENRERIEEMVQALDENRSSLGKLGEVNLAALEEYEELEARFAELQDQRDDLDASVQSIRSAISKMNRTCRERFRDAFDRVNEAFQEAYPRLVGGGSARLSLTNEDDLLETGVEIFVQPPGKRLTNLTLLSGGEKAMTAIALILALFKVKPSPFCVLDEVDAPLDEANGARFNEMLRDMSSITQFLVITHNRKTMECGDTLYGITMPTPGVSKLVTVDLDAHRHQPLGS